MTTPITEAGYPSDSSRTVSQFQTYTENNLSFIKEIIGGTGEAASVQLSSNSFAPGNNACVCVIDTNGMGPTDTLNNIDPETVRDGEVIYIRITDNSRIITISSGMGGVGQILTQDGNDIVLSDTRLFVPLKYNAAISAFEELNRTSLLGGGGGGVLNNFTATAYPQTTDDSTEGYSAGSLWYYTADYGYLAICTDPTAGSAVWQLLAILPANNMVASDVCTYGVSSALLQTVPESSGSLVFSPSFAYINGSRIATVFNYQTYSATSWTYDVVDIYSNIEHWTQAYDTDPPDLDPNIQVWFQLVVTDDDGNITAITPNPACQFVSGNLLDYAQEIPDTAGLVLQTVSTDTNPAGIQYGPIELGSIDPTGATANQLIGFDGTEYNLFNGLAGVSVSTDTSITLTAGSPSLQSLDATGGSIAVTLPASADVPGQVFIVANTTAGSNTVMVSLAGGDVQIGDAMLTLGSGNVVGLISDGTGNWISIVSM